MTDVLSHLVSTRTAADLAALVLLKGTIIVLILAVLARFFRTRSAAVRHRIWVTGLVTLVGIPVLGRYSPQWSVKTLPYPAETAFVGLDAVETQVMDATLLSANTLNGSEPQPVLPVASLLLLVWWTGVLVLLIAIVSSFVRAHLLRRRCQAVGPDHPLAMLLDEERQRLGIGKRIRLLIAPDEGLAATVGILRPEVILGSDVAKMPPRDLRPLFIHELAHVRRRDYLTHVVSTLALPLYWPNPLVWWARRMAAIEREQACDDEVLNRGVASPTYANLLLHFASIQSRLSTAAVSGSHLSFSPTKHRIGSILNEQLDRRPVGALASAALVILIVVVSLPTASLDVMASTPGTGTTADLVLALAHEDAGVRARAAHTLARRDPSRVRPKLEVLLDDPDAQVRLAAMAGLEQLADPASLPAMARVLRRSYNDGQGEHGFVLKYAMFALGKMGTVEAMQVLEKQLNRPVAPLRWLALETIHSMPGGREVARPHLERFARTDPSARNRHLAHKFLINN